MQCDESINSHLVKLCCWSIDLFEVIDETCANLQISPDDGSHIKLPRTLEMISQFNMAELRTQILYQISSLIQ